jgi:putative SOS response-associated peptidase YedK
LHRYYEWQKKASTKVPHFTRRPLSTKNTNTNTTTIADTDTDTDTNTDADAVAVANGSKRPLMFLAGLWDTVKYVSPVESHFQPSTDPEDKREPYPTGNPIPLSTFTILTTTPPKDFLWLHDRMPCVLTSWEDIERWLDLGEAKGWVEGKGGTGDLLKGLSGLES